MIKNAFVIGTGRCGTTTFYKACQHLAGLSVGHESRARDHARRFVYPVDHIEIDNRLSWRLDELVHHYPDALYIHLMREFDDVVASFLERWDYGIMRAWWSGVLMRNHVPQSERRAVVQDFIGSIRWRCEAFIGRHEAGGGQVLRVAIEEPTEGFHELAALMGATEGLEDGLAEFATKHNSRS